MQHRTFGLLDAMALVAAFAVGLWFNRTEWFVLAIPERTAKFHEFIPFLVALAMPYVAACSLAFLPIRLRRPRPSLRRIGGQPGWVACTVASTFLLAIGAWIAANAAMGRGILKVVDVIKDENANSVSSHIAQGAFWTHFFPAYADRIGFAVAGAWLALALSGWRSDAEWIDRLGRTLGWCWIAAMVALWARSFLM